MSDDSNNKAGTMQENRTSRISRLGKYAGHSPGRPKGSADKRLVFRNSCFKVFRKNRQQFEGKIAEMLQTKQGTLQVARLLADMLPKEVHGEGIADQTSIITIVDRIKSEQKQAEPPVDKSSLPVDNNDAKVINGASDENRGT